MTSKEVIRILRKNGWIEVRVKGSHHIFLKEGAVRPIVVPCHGNTDIGFLAATIFKEAGIEVK